MSIIIFILLFRNNDCRFIIIWDVCMPGIYILPGIHSVVGSGYPMNTPITTSTLVARELLHMARMWPIISPISTAKGWAKGGS